MKTITIVSYNTESGDEGILAAFDYEPTEDEIDTIARDQHPDEYAMYDGEEDCTIYFRKHSELLRTKDEL